MDDDNPTQAPEERFATTGGLFSAIVALALAGLGLIFALVDSEQVHWTGVAVCAGLVWAAWAVFLRPRAFIAGDRLVLRNIVTTTTIPLAAIDEVVVRQVLVVTVGDRRFTCPGVGRPRRQLVRDQRVGVEAPQNEIERAEHSYGLFVEDRIRARADEALAKRGIRRYSAEHDALMTKLADDVVRAWAVPELAALVAIVLGLVVSVVV